MKYIPIYRKAAADAPVAVCFSSAEADTNLFKKKCTQNLPLLDTPFDSGSVKMVYWDLDKPRVEK